MTEAELRETTEGWIADDPDAGDRAELHGLLERAFGGPGGSDSGALAELRDRFAGRLEFGTAGLRGVVAAGPNRMNRAVVRAATAAVAGWLLGSAGGGSAGGGSAGGGWGGGGAAGGGSAGGGAAGGGAAGGGSAGGGSAGGGSAGRDA